MKRTPLALLLCLAFVALFSLAFAQSPRHQGEGRPSPAAELREVKAKKGRVVAERLRTLLAPLGVSVGEATPDDREQAAQVRAYMELRIRWDAYPDAPKAVDADDARRLIKSRRLTIVRRQRHQGTLPQPRAFEPSEGQILAVAVDGMERLRWWTLVEDPRVLRAEGPGADLQLTGRVLHRPRPEFVVNVPVDPSVKALRLYQAVWNGSEFVLEPFESVAF